MKEPPSDINGREIKAGDLMRHPHFRDSRRRMHYLYHVAVMNHDGLAAVPYAEIVRGRSDGGRFYLRDGDRLTECCEIVESIIDDNLQTHWARPRDAKKAGKKGGKK